MFLYSAVSSPLDRSKRFTLSSLSRPVHSGTNRTSLGSILAMPQLTCNDYSLTFPPPSIVRYSFIQLKPGTHHAIFVVCWTQRRRKDDCCMVCAHQRQLSPVDFTNATVVGPIRKTNRSNNCCMVCAGQRHLSHQPTGHRPITVKHFRDA